MQQKAFKIAFLVILLLQVASTQAQESPDDANLLGDWTIEVVRAAPSTLTAPSTLPADSPPLDEATLERSLYSSGFANETVLPTNCTNATANSTNCTNATSNSTSNSTGTNATNSTSGNSTNSNSTANNSTNSSSGSTNTTNITIISTGNATETLDTIGITVNPNITIAPPPAISSSVLATLSYSPVGNLFIGSKRIENLEITQAASASTFKINIFNRSEPSRLKTHTLSSVSGTWSYLTGTKDTLSCSLVYDSVGLRYGFLALSTEAGTLTMVSTITQASLPAAMSSLTSTQIANQIVLGANCDMALFGQNVYKIGATSLTVMGSALAAGVGAGIGVQAYSINLAYIISSNVLYKLNTAGTAYSSLLTLTTYQVYSLFNKDNKLVVVGSNSLIQSNGKYQVNQTISILKDNSGVIETLSTTTIVSSNNLATSVPVFVSPLMTKVHFEYLATVNSSAIVTVKNVDYESSLVTDLTLNSQSRYFETTVNILSYSSKNYFLGDYYMIIRNQSGLVANSALPAVEEAYQFVGDTIMVLRNRELLTYEKTDCYKIAIDDFYPNSLVILNLYTVGTTEHIYEFTYGSLASIVKIVPPPIPSYINYTIPASTSAFSSASQYEWTYITQGATTTTFNFNSEDSTDTDHLISETFTINGVWSMIKETSNCKLLLSSTATYNLYLYNSTAISFTLLADLSAQIATVSPSPSAWRISEDCSKVAADNIIFAKVSGTYTKVANDYAIFTWLDMDATMSYALLSDSVWRYNSATNLYTSAFTHNGTTFAAGATIRSYSDRIVAIFSSSTTFMIRAYRVNATTGVNVLSFSFTTYTAAPTFSISPKLTKVVVIGSITGSATQTNGFFIDYANSGSQTIAFPTEAIAEVAFTVVQVEESWLYVRQRQNPSVAVSVANAKIEYAYYLQQDTIPVLIKNKNIADSEHAKWIRTIIKTIDSTGDLYIMKQITTAGKVIVELLEVSAGLMALKSEGASSVSGVLVDGEIKLCTPGCSDCSSGSCTTCMTGFVLDSSTSTCFICGPNCLTCSSTNPLSCTTCVSGAFLKSATCQPCDVTCLTCTGSATSCQDCLPGQYFDGAKCASCARNCLACTSNTTCTLCKKGFAVSLGKCRGCSMSCSDCSPTDIMTCTACGSGLQLSNGACISCPKHCKSCNNGKCAVCIGGYQPNSAGVCVKNCELPCAKCVDNQPKNCTACFSGSTLTSGKCIFKETCNGDNSCTDCGQGTNLILVGAKCYDCPKLKNCLQCSSTNTQLCSICASGYFVNSTVCSACPTSCLSCTSSTSCTSCQVGYTLPQGVETGPCLLCVAPCLTCSGTTTYCTSCVDGYTKKGWKCQSNINVGFSFTVTANVAQILGKIDDIVSQLLGILGLNSTQVDLITFTAITASVAAGNNNRLLQATSSSISGGYTPETVSTTAVTSASTALASSLSSGTSLGSFPVTSSSVVSNGVTTTTETASDSNLPLMIGLFVGIPIALAVIIFAVYMIYTRVCKEEQPVLDKFESSQQEIIQNSSMMVKDPDAAVELEEKDRAALDEKQLSMNKLQDESPTKMQGETFSEMEMMMHAYANPIINIDGDNEEFADYVQPRQPVEEAFEAIETIVFEEPVYVKPDFNSTAFKPSHQSNKSLNISNYHPEEEIEEINLDYRPTPNDPQGSLNHGKSFSKASLNSQFIHVTPLKEPEQQFDPEDEFGDFVEYVPPEFQKVETFVFDDEYRLAQKENYVDFENELVSDGYESEVPDKSVATGNNDFFQGVPFENELVSQSSEMSSVVLMTERESVAEAENKKSFVFEIELGEGQSEIEQSENGYTEKHTKKNEAEEDEFSEFN